MSQRKTIQDLQKAYRAGRPLSMVTCYDYTFARLTERANMDILLIGDSLGNVIQGQDTTLPVEVEDIIYHTRAVARGNQTGHLLADMPFMSYQVCAEDALRNAGRIMKQSGASSVKLEGGLSIAPTVRRLVDAGIPVCGHLGLTPQSFHTLSGYRVQGKGDDAAQRMIDDALALQDAGAYMIVLEMVPAALGKRVTEALVIPIIGIGAGVHTSGQVLVMYDLLGLNDSFKPKFLKRYAELGLTVEQALTAYREEVEARAFPDDAHSF
jgi:3-methyl-2-oxobutanoate hydroxymethyltransferase